MKTLKLLNRSEETVRLTLTGALSDYGFYIAPQLKLDQVICREPEERLSRPDRRFLRESSFDFVVVSEAQQPVLAIEFDGPVHDEYDRKRKADIRKNRLCREAGLPLIRVKDELLLERHQHNFLEFIVWRFAIWPNQRSSLIAEITERLACLEDDEAQALVADGWLDPSIDPGFLFDLKAPYPGTELLGSDLLRTFDIGSPFGCGGIEATPERTARRVRESTSYLVNWVIGSHEFGVWSGTTEKAEFETTSTVAVLGEMPVEEEARDLGPLAGPIDGADLSIAFEGIPGLSAEEFSHAACDFFCMNRIQSWAQETLSTP